MRTLVMRMLSRLKIKVVAKEDGQRGLQVLEGATQPVDLIICDWNMPGMSGMSCIVSAGFGVGVGLAPC